MNEHQKLSDEVGRLAALRRYDVLDTPPEEPFDKLTQLVRNVLGVPIAAVSLVDAERQWFKSIAGLSACETSREVSFCSHAIEQRKPFVIPDATLDVRFARNPLVTGSPMIRSYLGIPLKTPDGYNLGALCAIDVKPRDFTSSEISILSNFADLVFNELELRQAAMSDGLTGAMTRRAFFDAAKKEISRSRRHGSQTALVIFDIDHFKEVNDTYGHPAGDVVLKEFAQRCFATLRDGDLMGRIGGEEFALLLPETDTAGAKQVSERLRRKFADKLVDIDGTALSITASFGICNLNDSLSDVDGWFAAADALLYDAKANGRNCCCCNKTDIGTSVKHAN